MAKVIPNKTPTATVQPGALVDIEAWALIRKDGGLSPLKVSLTLDTRSLEVDVGSVEVLPADYRALSQAKVFAAISNNTPTWVK